MTRDSIQISSTINICCASSHLSDKKTVSAFHLIIFYCIHICSRCFWLQFLSEPPFIKVFVTRSSLWLTPDRQLLSVCLFPGALLFPLPFALPSGPPAGSTAGSRAAAWWGWTPRAGHRSCTAGCWRSPAPCTPQTSDRRHMPTAGERKEEMRVTQRGKHKRPCFNKVAVPICRCLRIKRHYVTDIKKDNCVL